MYNLQSWQFQHTIPTLFSEYYLVVPEYFYYNQAQRGYFYVDLKTGSKRNSVTITHTNVHTTKISQERVGRNQQTVNYEENTFDYVAKDIPAFPVEAHLTTAQNYISKVDFELAWTKFPNQTEEHYTLSWDNVNHKLLNHGNFGHQLKRERFLNEEVEQLRSQHSDTLDLIISAFDLIKRKFIWNGTNSKYASSTLRDAYKSGAGNCADINLTLVVLLRELGMEAYPVLLSTRSNGMIHPSHPSLSSFNYVVAMVIDGQKTYLMDATEPLSEINLLPTRCLNNDGWIVDETKPGWINLYNGDFGKSASYDLVLDEEGSFNGELKYAYINYSAYEERLKAARETDIETYLQKKFDNISGLTINNSQLTGMDRLNTDLEAKLDVTISGKLENAGNLYFFEPMFLDGWKKNPFIIENREYPVEFEYPMTDMQSVSIIIPEGYIVEDLPTPAIVKLKDGSAKFTYNISQLGNKLQIISVFSINKVFFLPDEYPFLKQIIDLVVDKHKEQIVLKKI